jgi:hypothetical protein
MEGFWSSFLQGVLIAFAPVLASLVTALIVAQIKLALQKARNAQPDAVDTLEWVAKTAVAAAEQAGAAKLIQDKREYAIDVADMWLTSKGLDLDIEMIAAAIESAVWTEINSQKQPVVRSIGLIPQ